MNGIIYKITNQSNGKMYIGQTTTSLKERWSKHKNKSKTSSSGLYGAIQKYGIENFKIEIITCCQKEELNNLEIFYINKYDTFYNGYNLTTGGNNAPTNGLNLDEIEVINKYKELKYITDTAKYFNCCEKTISNILEKNKIEKNRIPKNINQIKNYHHDTSKKILIIELNLSFNSILECGKWLIENGISKTLNPTYAQKSISRVLNGERKSYCKLHFQVQ